MQALKAGRAYLPTRDYESLTVSAAAAHHDHLEVLHLILAAKQRKTPDQNYETDN